VLRLAADENFDNAVLRGLRLRQPAVDIVRAQDVGGLSGADDPSLLAWAAVEERILLTHDASTMPDFAYARVAAGQAMSGIFVVSAGAATGPIIEELLLILECSEQDEWRDHVCYLPLR
jgi:predicted nuclease of predicted toxin-antitoxin system